MQGLGPSPSRGAGGGRSAYQCLHLLVYSQINVGFFPLQVHPTPWKVTKKVELDIRISENAYNKKEVKKKSASPKKVMKQVRELRF